MADPMPMSNQVMPRRRVAKGPRRPQYLADAELDKFMMMFTALMSEYSAMRDRLDTYEALTERGLAITRANVENYALPDDERALREARREALLKRVFRVLLEEAEEAKLAISPEMLDEVLADDEVQSTAA